jgi:Tfp pilus assembly protein FimT
VFDGKCHFSNLLPLLIVLAACVLCYIAVPVVACVWMRSRRARNADRALETEPFLR